jgi:hypothetical protein
MKYIGIIGTRRRDTSAAYKLVEDKFNEIYKDGDWIVSGGCEKGGDRFAEVIAKKTGIPIIIFYPNYTRYGRGAPFLRNTTVADKSDILIACVAPDRKGGTEDTINKYLNTFQKDKKNLHIV